MNHLLANIQNGCRRGRTTVDHLVRLETFIRDSFAHNRHVISVFFDLKKAYDSTLKYVILKDLHGIRLRGRLPRYIKEFLSERRFRVRVNGACSNSYPQEEGVPQGCVLSATLFAIKINGVQAAIIGTRI